MIGSNAIRGSNCQYNEAEKIFDMKKHLIVFFEQKKTFKFLILKKKTFKFPISKKK